MISKEMIEAALKKLGLPYAYRQFTEEEAVPPPFLVWHFDSSNNFSADDKVYSKIYELNIEIYTEKKDFDLESAVEEMLDDLGLFWQKEEEWIESEKLFEVLYYMEVIYGE